MEEKRNGYWVLVRKPEFQKPFERSKRRWLDVRMELRKQVWGLWTGMMWFGRGTSVMCYILGEMQGSRACVTLT
jgi:hypothetical protein